MLEFWARKRALYHDEISTPARKRIPVIGLVATCVAMKSKWTPVSREVCILRVEADPEKIKHCARYCVSTEKAGILYKR